MLRYPAKEVRDITINDRIALRRKELNMTQQELALKVGYTSKSTINKIELGINDVKHKKIKIFADALQTTTSWLMGWDEPDNKPKLTEKQQQLVDLAPKLDDDVAEQLTALGKSIMRMKQK